MPSSYQPGIPTGLVFLDQDYANIQQNFQALDTYFGEDHVPFSVDTLAMPSGYHQDIHMVPISTVASNAPNNQPVNGYTATPGFGQIFSAQINDGINIDEALYFLSGGNRLVQLTRNFAPILANKGVTMLPGGLILNWGTSKTDATKQATPTFIQPFPTAIYTIQCTVKMDDTTEYSIKIRTTTGTNPVTGFTARASAKDVVFSWIAIGI